MEDTAAPAAGLCAHAEFQALLTWTQMTNQQDTGIGLPWPTAFGSTTEPLRPPSFKDAPAAALIKATDQVPAGTELRLHLARSEMVCERRSRKNEACMCSAEGSSCRLGRRPGAPGRRFSLSGPACWVHELSTSCPLWRHHLLTPR